VAGAPAFFDAGGLRRAMPPLRAVAALEAVFAADLPSSPPRTAMEFPGGHLLTMPAAGEAGIGVKLVTLAAENPARGLPYIHGLYVLFDAETGAPVCCIDGTELTTIRTSAVSALATKFLARVDARRLVIFGSGVQAQAHVSAIRAVRSIDDVTIVGRSQESALRLCGRLRADGIIARPGTAEAVANADIVCTCTTATATLFDGALLADGAHVNAIGGYGPTVRELDTATILRARVIVETREAALAEGGDLVIPIGEGAIDASHIIGELADVITGAVGRTGAEEITVFKSVGVAFEDLAIAAAVVGGPAGTAPLAL
jgi:ornithine cyclodeaminase/alanine dehydrogenase-like protein (mu-crystallin family)